MAKVWGRWCGPNWTAGRAIPANDYDWETDPSPNVQDNLDAACKVHDRVYAETTNSTQLNLADDLLVNKAGKIALKNPTSRKGIVAGMIVAGITAQAESRRWSS